MGNRHHDWGISTRTHQALFERFNPCFIVDVGYSLASGNRAVGFGYVTASATMLQALRDLATAKKEGLLSDEQYEKQHAALLACR